MKPRIETYTTVAQANAKALTQCLHKCLQYQKALEEIANLANVTEVRGPMEGWFTPDHLVSDDGFVPIDPRFKRGMVHVAVIAARALGDG